GPHSASLWPVDDIEIDVVDAKPSQAPLRLGDRVLECWMELSRKKDVPADNAAVTQRATDALLVAISLGGVDVPVAGLEREAHCVDGLGSLWHLPYTEA